MSYFLINQGTQPCLFYGFALYICQLVGFLLHSSIYIKNYNPYFWFKENSVSQFRLNNFKHDNLSGNNRDFCFVEVQDWVFYFLGSEH